MRRIAPLALLIVCLLNANAQTSVPIKVEKLPAVPVIHPSLTDKASSSLVAEMMPFVAPLVFETPEITSSLVLANASIEATTATVTLFSADGKKSVRQTLTLAPHEKKEVRISSPQDSTGQKSRWGSVTVEQDPHTTGVVVAGQVIVTDKRASTPAYIDEELAMPEMEGSTSLLAVTDQSEGSPMLAITNTSAVLQHVSITCIRDSKNSKVSRIEVAGHATATTEVCANTSPSTLADYVSSIEEGNAEGVYGIKLDGDGPPGSFAAFALAPHHREHDLVFSSVPFYDPGMIHSSDVVFAGVPIGAQNTLPAGVYIPRLSLANFAESPLKFSIQLSDTVTSPVVDADGNSQPPMVNVLHTGTIPPHQTGEYVFSGQEAQNGLLHSVVVATEAKPGTYQAKLVSRSTGILYQVELLAKETREMNNAGIHPWSVQGDSKSHIVLFNHSKNNAKIGIFISAGSATLWASEMMLAASETREVSINQLQKEQIPDDHGRRIPISATEGVVDWRTPNSGEVTGRLMVTSQDRAMARNFSCGTYYGVCALYLSTYYTDIAVGGALPMYGASADYCNFNPNAPNRCINGTPMNGTVNYYWSVGTTSIIKLNTSSDEYKAEPTLKGVSPGSGYATVEAEAGSCTSTGGGNPSVGCLAQLYYRPVFFLGESVGNHTFWYVLDQNNEQWVIDAGPSNQAGCPLNCGYLNAWETLGTVGYYPEDSITTATLWPTAPPTNMCNGAFNLEVFEEDWANNTTKYALNAAPNSNSFTHQAAVGSAVPATAPPNTPGW